MGSEYAGLEFWLSSISCHAPGAPVLIVGTHIDQVSVYALNEDSLKIRYKQIVGFFYVSNYTQSGIEELAEQLVHVTLQQKYIGERIPVILILYSLSFFFLLYVSGKNLIHGC